MEVTLQNLCRLCGDERKYTYNVFVKSEDNIALVDVVRSVLNIVISEQDTIPKEICSLCHTYLLGFLKFKDIAEKTQLFLSDLETNLEKEKIASQSTHRDSVDLIKMEEGTYLDMPLDVHSDDSFISMDDNVPLIQVLTEKIKIPESGKRSRQIPQGCTYEEKGSKKTTANEDPYEQSIELSIENPIDNLNNLEECNICHKQFTKERYLRLHLRLTHKIVIESKYPCNRCTRKFMQKQSYERHMQLHDDPDFNKPLPCEICGKNYVNKQTLKAHIRTIHMDSQKKFVCEECGALFKGISSLKSHQITHTGEFPFQCPKCDRRFQNKSNLIIHMDIHSETPYVCKVCNKTSTTLRGLRLHMVNHSDNKPHKCHMCGNSYKRVTALKKHLIVHSGIKPYTCNFCDRTFADGSNKRIHMKRVHKKELAEMEAAGLKAVPTSLPKIQHLREDSVSD